MFVHAPPSELVVGQPDVAVIAAQALGGETLVFGVRAMIALALLTSVSAMILAGPRVYARMAEDGVFPRFLKFQESTPKVAIAIQAMLAIVVVWISSLQDLLSYLGFTLSLSSAGAVACVFKLPKRVGLGAKIAAFIYVIMTLLIASLAASRSPWPSLAGTLTIGSGLLVYWIMRGFGRNPQ